MNYTISTKLKNLPETPGVYLMKDSKGKIIYVGKAVNLKKRVSQYFHKNHKIKRIEKLVENIADFDYIVTDTEDEALLLENNMIKKHKPKYNVLLKDDKTYSYIKVDMKSEYPTYSMTRKVVSDGSRYFGPFPSSGTTRALLEYIRENYKIRRCNPFMYRDKPCLYYHIDRCPAPCIKGTVSKEEYMAMIHEINRILSSNMIGIITELEKQMKDAARDLQFEKAARIRDNITSIRRGSEKQKINNFNFKTIDAIGLYRNEIETVIIVFEVRGSRLQGMKKYFLGDTSGFSEKEVVEMFLKQYYIGFSNIPNKIMVKEDFEDRKALEKMFSESMGYKVEIVVPKIGSKLKFVEMAEENAKVELENKDDSSIEMLKELREKLILKKIPRRIEAYDNSNIAGDFQVSAMAVMIDGKMDKRSYRRFRIDGVYGQDDYLCMKKTIKKRFNHTIQGKKGLGYFPDLIIADGGIGQIHAIEEALDEILKELDSDLKSDLESDNDDNNYNSESKDDMIRKENAKKAISDLAVYGLVKDDKHRTRALVSASGVEIVVSENTMRKLSHLQEEVHDAAINYHRKLRDKEMTKSVLDDIPGIGEAKKKELLKTFGSVENIFNASVDEIAKVKGVSKALAQKIKESEGGN